MTRRIALEIFDDPERCERELAMCDYLVYEGGLTAECGLLQLELGSDADNCALRCPECKAAEIREVANG
jgi:hypothetical protein